MGLNLTNETILFFDTAPFIYFFEGKLDYCDKVAKLIDEIYSANAQITTSLITYIEITTQPAKSDDKKTWAKYRDYFTNSESLSLQPLNLSIAENTIQFRAKYNFSTPDAIQLSTALFCGADYIITNDNAWRRVEEFPVVLISEL